MNMFSSSIIRGSESVESEFRGPDGSSDSFQSSPPAAVGFLLASWQWLFFFVCCFVLFFRDVLFLIKLMLCEQTAPLIIVHVTVCRGCPNHWNQFNYNSGLVKFFFFSKMREEKKCKYLMSKSDKELMKTCPEMCHLFTKQNKAVLFPFISLYLCMVSHSEGAAGCCGKFWGRSSLGKNPFSRGRSQVSGVESGPERTTGWLLSPWYHFLTGRLQTASLRLDRWTMLYTSALLFLLLFVHPTIFCSFCRQSAPLNTHLVGFCMPPPPADLADFPLQEHASIHAFARADTPMPCLRISQTLLCCRTFHHARRVLFTQKPRGVCGSRKSKIVADNKGYRPRFLNTVG